MQPSGVYIVQRRYLVRAGLREWRVGNTNPLVCSIWRAYLSENSETTDRS